MKRQDQREQWLRHAHELQHNIVFPKTLTNETRFWRNLVAVKQSPATKIGLVIMAVFVLGLAATLIRILFLAGATWLVAIAVLLVWGPIFAAISWATKRNLRNIKDTHGNFKARKP